MESGTYEVMYRTCRKPQAVTSFLPSSAPRDRCSRTRQTLKCFTICGPSTLDKALQPILADLLQVTEPRVPPGKYQIDVRIAKQSGLNTKYYSDANLAMLTFSSIDSNIDYDWGNESPYQNGFSDEFNVGWTGFLRARYQVVHTFQIQLFNPLERVKLWVDDEWIIDQWSSLQSIATSGTLFLSSQLLVDVEMPQYRANTGQSKVQLWWNSLSQVDEVIPSSSFFSSADPIQGSPFGVSIFPALSCGATSIARGDGLSLATAGYPATFQITARDHLNNFQTTSLDQFVVRVRHTDNQNFTMRDS
eukprot:757640-Hanusia_phi.AAC.2